MGAAGHPAPAGVVVGTGLLHRRWRGWVRALPAPEQAAASPGGADERPSLAHRSPIADGPLDPSIHEASRLVLVSVLNECVSADFNFLLAAAGLTRGNLSAHMAKLVAAGYAEETKQFVNRKQLTPYRLSPAGRDAYATHRANWLKITGGA